MAFSLSAAPSPGSSKESSAWISAFDKAQIDLDIQPLTFSELCEHQQQYANTFAIGIETQYLVLFSLVCQLDMGMKAAWVSTKGKTIWTR